MLHKINFLFVFSTICLAFVAPTTASQTSPSDLVREAERSRFALMIAADTTALRQELHPDLLYLHSNGLEESADDLVASVASGKIDYQSFEPLQDSHVQIFDNIALVDGLVRVTGLYQGDAFAVDLRYTSVYQKVDGRWLLIRWQSTKV